MKIKASQFLRNGAMALMAASAFMVAVPHPSHDISPNISQAIPTQMLTHLSDGLDYLSYKTVGKSVTQNTEIYRFNVLKNAMMDSFNKDVENLVLDKSDIQQVNDNLNKAKELGIFKDKESFEGEMKVLAENTSVKNPVSLENLIKFVKDGEPLTQRDALTSDINTKSHYDGITNISEAKQNVIKNIEKIREIRETKSNSMENILKNRPK
jgi:hypothetical protein